MIVRDFHQYYTELRARRIRQEIYLGGVEDYFETNLELIKAKKDFNYLMKKKICDTIFSYFPELKTKEAELKPYLEHVIIAQAPVFFQTVFDLIYDYLVHPNKMEEFTAWKFNNQTEEEIIEKASKFVVDLPDEIKEQYKISLINSHKNRNRIYHFELLMHKTVLACTTDIFLEIPELPSNGIRYLNYKMAANTSILKDDLYDIFANDLQKPYSEFDF